MGYSTYSHDAYVDRSASRATAAVHDYMNTSAGLLADLDPKGVTRESRDSEDHPFSNPVIISFDVTGSMGGIPAYFAKEKLGGLMRMLVSNGWLEDPQVLMSAIGDHLTDRVPLQVGQFESGLEMDDDLTKIYLEGWGGGTREESYHLAWKFAAQHTETDCWDKRNKKGYLFTMGDEGVHKTLTAQHVQKIFGGQAEDMDVEQLLALAQEKWEVFHIHVQDGSYRDNPVIMSQWRELLGQRFLVLDNKENICELIGTQIALCEGTLHLSDLDAALTAYGLTAPEIKNVTAALAIREGTELEGAAVTNGTLPAVSDESSIERL